MVMRKMETDVIVVAAGLSGLAACISAAENGARVLVFEKSNTTGGAANMGMGPLGVGSRIQREHMISLTPGEAFRKHMYFTHYRVDARMVRDYYFKSGDTIDWLSDMGVEFAGVQRAFSAARYSSRRTSAASRTNIRSLFSRRPTFRPLSPAGRPVIRFVR